MSAVETDKETRKPPPLLRTAVVLTALFLAEGFGLGMFFLFSIITSIFGVLFLVPLGMVAGATDARALAINRFKRAGMYLVLGVASLVTFNFRTVGLRADGERVIEACRAYKARHGAFPEHLEDLVPTDLPAVPPHLQYWDWSSRDTKPHHVLTYIVRPTLVPSRGRELVD